MSQQSLSKSNHTNFLLFTGISIFFLVSSYQSKGQIPVILVGNFSNTIKLSRPLNTADNIDAARNMVAGKLATQIPASHKLKYIERIGNIVKVTDMSDGSTHFVKEDELDIAKKTINIAPIGGAFTFPFKYRSQTNVLEPTLSLSGVVGINLGLDKNNAASIGFLVGFGPSSITIDKTNSTDTSSTGSTRTAATLSFTVLSQWNKIQLAFSTGIDNNLDNSADKWIYQSKPWFSLGIGFNIFSSSGN